jgi:hypothetical protein
VKAAFKASLNGRKDLAGSRRLLDINHHFDMGIFEDFPWSAALLFGRSTEIKWILLHPRDELIERIENLGPGKLRGALRLGCPGQVDDSISVRCNPNPKQHIVAILATCNRSKWLTEEWMQWSKLLPQFCHKRVRLGGMRIVQCVPRFYETNGVGNTHDFRAA